LSWLKIYTLHIALVVVVVVVVVVVMVVVVVVIVVVAAVVVRVVVVVVVVVVIIIIIIVVTAAAHVTNFSFSLSAMSITQAHTCTSSQGSSDVTSKYESSPCLSLTTHEQYYNTTFI